MAPDPSGSRRPAALAAEEKVKHTFDAVDFAEDSEDVDTSLDADSSHNTHNADPSGDLPKGKADLSVDAEFCLDESKSESTAWSLTGASSPVAGQKRKRGTVSEENASAPRKFKTIFKITKKGEERQLEVLRIPVPTPEIAESSDASLSDIPNALTIAAPLKVPKTISKTFAASRPKFSPTPPPPPKKPSASKNAQAQAEQNAGKGKSADSTDNSASLAQNGGSAESVVMTAAKGSAKPPKAEEMKPDTYKYSEGITPDIKPIATVDGMIQDMVKKFVDLADFAQDDTLPLKVATACSGTEMPIVVLEMVAKYLHLRKSRDEKSFTLLVEHMFSAEIVAWKQAYIQRNFKPPVLFRDISEWLPKGPNAVLKSTTAFGSMKDVPTSLDMFIGGFCCVDFSRLNVAPKTLDARGQSGDTFHSMMAYLKVHKPKIVIMENVAGAPWKDVRAISQKDKNILIARAVETAVAERLAELQKLDSRVEEVPKKELAKLIKQETKRVQADKTTNGGLSRHLDDVGYASSYVKADTKDYYIPQTRIRGYLIAINIEKFRETMPKANEKQVGAEITKAMNKWKFLMNEFKRATSVPVEAMLVAAEDDSQPTLSRRTEVLAMADTKATPWVMCKPNHAMYRSINGFGDERNLTYWLDNGFRKSPDHWAYLKGMTDRVADALEISHLRCLVRGFDDRFYSRYLDLSQNVYRLHDDIKNGLIGCLTPSGIPFWTYKGRRITGRESLVLQGLPVNLLDLSYLSEANLQDFCGNAMTSTVVAAAMFSAMIAFKRLLPTRRDSLMSIDKPKFASVSGMLEKDIDPTIVKNPMSVDFAKSMAARTVSLCYCEGRHDKLDKIFLRCTICRHTGCSECSGNPTHSFERIEEAEVSRRKLPAFFETLLQDALPTMIRLPQLGDILESIAKENPRAHGVPWEAFEGYYKAALSSDFFLKKVGRSHTWEAIYQSPKAKLVLKISGTQVQWLLYAIPDVEYGIAHPMHVFLEGQPIARLIPAGSDITKGGWEVFVPKYQLVDATITSSGELFPSYESRMGLHEHQDQYVFDRCSIKVQPADAQLWETDITGDYELHSGCGQAFGSLHVKTSTKNEETPLFFFLDHSKQRGDPWKHQYAFTHDAQRQKPMAQRAVVGQLVPLSPFPSQSKDKPEVPRNLSWRQPRVKREMVDLQYQYKSRVSSAADSGFEEVTDDIRELKIVDEVKIAVPGFWAKSGLPMSSCGGPLIHFRQIPENSPSSLFNISCKVSTPIFECSASIPENTARNYASNQIYQLDPTNQLQVLGDLLWVLRPVLRLSGYRLSRSARVDTFNTSDDTSEKWYQLALSLPLTNCESCAPERPMICWAINKLAKSTNQEPYEHPEMAARYEECLKGRPNAVNLEFFIERVVGEGGTKIPVVHIRISVNFKTLVHRALFDLDPSGSVEAVKASISLVTDEVAEPLKRFKPFIFPDSRRIEKDLPKNDTKKIDQCQLSGNYKLRPEQCRSVAWQVDQENNHPKFIERIIVEEQTKFGYRASAMVSRPNGIKGGCLFHPVGFGKTAVVLGLIAKQEGPDRTRTEKEAENFVGQIPLKATLIIMSSQLTGQWKGEVEKFLGGAFKKSVIVINTMAQWKSHSIKDFQNAKIVIVAWSLLDNDTYLDHLAQFAGMVGIDGKHTSRGYASFHEAVMKNIAKNVDILRSDSANFEDKVNAQIVQNVHDNEVNLKPIPSRIVKGAAYQDQKRAKAAEEVVQPSSGTYDAKVSEFQYVEKGPKDGGSWTSTRLVPFEAFSWSRVVADEFPYMTDVARTTMTNLKKRNLWLVSATPKLDSFEQVRQLASFFNINLGIKEFALMAKDEWKKSTDAMTASEKFLAYDNPKSPAWYDFRNVNAQAFLDMCAVCDEPSYDQIQSRHHIELSFAPAVQMAASWELMQCLAATANGSLPHQALGNGNRDLQIKEAFGKSKIAVQALLKQAGHFDHNADPGFVSTQQRTKSDSALEITVQCRKRLLKLDTREFKRKLKDVSWLAQHENIGNGAKKWQNFQDCLRSNQWGDKPICDELLSLISTAMGRDNTEAFIAGMAAKHANGAMAKVNGKQVSKVQASLRNIMKDLNGLVDEIIKQTRAVRFMEAAQACQSQGKSSRVCGICDRAILSLKKLMVLAGCGHMVCADCLDSKGTCPSEGCKSGHETYRRISGDLFAIPGTHDEVSSFGQKAEDLIRLIDSIPKNEKALIFVQTDVMIAYVEELLDACGVPRATLGQKQDSQQVLSRFQKNEGTQKVLILNIASESAAGCNLTIASHVIFYAPFMTTGSSGQSTYKATMEQAIGRAVRYGQSAACVKIYHLMTAYTVDVDVFEHRNQKVVAYDKATDKYELQERKDQEVSGKYASCVSHLVHDA